MLNIYYGRESIDKERFIFEEIKRTGFDEKHRTVVIVPDQYTLEAERAAFACLNVKSLIGLDVYGFSRLGHKVLSELGGAGNTFIDKYGRQMLLTKVIKRQEEDLELFKGNLKRNSFVEMINDLISELKQYNVTPEKLEKVCEALPEDDLLGRKLREIRLLYDVYEHEINGKYTDSEDLIDMYTEKMPESSVVRGSEVWIYGFDSFSPKNVQVIERIMMAAHTVNVVLTYDENCRDEELFVLSGEMMRRLKQAAANINHDLGKIAKIEVKTTKAEAIEHLEKELFAIDTVPAEADPAPAACDGISGTANHKAYGEGTSTSESSGVNAATEGITICEAANMYGEAESAAEFILKLLREEGYRYRDIVLICNDLQTRGGIISRVFEEYGIPVFHDAKRKIINSAPAIYLISMLETVLNGYRTSDIFRTLKSGMINLSQTSTGESFSDATFPGEEIERLENYALKYRIQGGSWKKPFKYGSFEYSEEELQSLEALRKKVVAIFEGLEKIVRDSKTVGEFIESYYNYLIDDLRFEENLNIFMHFQMKHGAVEYAEETRQILSMVIGILEQLVELIGDELLGSGNDPLPGAKADLGSVESPSVTGVGAGSGGSPSGRGVGVGSGGSPSAADTDPESDALPHLSRKKSVPADRMEFADFIELFRVGLSGIEVGRLPSSIDDLILGTMQRTRSGDVKAVVVVGANEGVLPEIPTDEGLFAFDELDRLADSGLTICKPDKLRTQEERLAIYRNLCKPSKHLWISYSKSDEEGKEIKRSSIVDTICRIFPKLIIEKDIVNRDDDMALVGGKYSTLRYLSEHMRRGVNINAAEKQSREEYTGGDEQGDQDGCLEGAEAENKSVRQDVAAPQAKEELWKLVERWYEKDKNANLQIIRQGVCFDNRPNHLEHGLTGSFFKEDYGGNKVLSASRLEKYAHCPFSYYVSRVLAPVEFREFQVASREIGDVYHACIMKVTEILSRENMWEDVSEEACEKLIDEAVTAVTANYRDGLFSFGKEEEYKLKRIKETCLKSLKILIDHVRKGKVKDSLFEVEFGKNKKISPIIIDAGGNEVFIEGIIDRVDYLENGRVKIIDYKSGENTLSREEAESGYRLQLMLYIKAAQENQRKPAGVFYFRIKNPRLKEKGEKRVAEDFVENLKKSLMKEFRLEGFVVDDPETIRCIDGEFESRSDVMKVAVDKKNKGFKGKALLSEEDFSRLQDSVESKVKELIERMNDGNIDIRPMKLSRSADGQEKTACDYCDYKSICRFDTQFKGCEYNVVK